MNQNFLLYMESVRIQNNLILEERRRANDSLLQGFIPEVNRIFEQGLNQFPRKKVKQDDLLDAICLALSAQLGHQYSTQFIQGKTKQDPRGLFIRMVYPNIP